MFLAPGRKRHSHNNAAVRKHRKITQCCFNVTPASKTLKQHWVNATCLRKEYSRPSDGLVLVQHRNIEPAMGCDAGPTVNRNLVGRPTSSVRAPSLVGGGTRVVVSTAAFHARVRGSVPGLGGLKETKIASSPSTCES